jgi:hypothetical protein
MREQEDWDVEDQAFDWAHDEEGKGLSIYAQDIVDLLTYSMRLERLANSSRTITDCWA